MAILEEHATLADWMRAEMSARSIDSGRQFAEWLGLSYATVNGMLSPSARTAPPRVSTLGQMARKTHTNVFLLIALAYPEYRDDLGKLTSASPGILLRAQLIEALPKHVRQVIDGIIMDADSRRRD
jgi:hypothetical protein